MMKRLITVCLSVLILSLAAVYAAEKDKASVQIDPSKLPPPAEKKDVTYNADIKPLLEKSCVKCHGAADKPKAGLRLDSKGAVLQGSKNGKVIEVGKAADSKLYEAITKPKDDRLVFAVPKRRDADDGAKMRSRIRLGKHDP